jgi:CRP-like cAMP-binding protein
MIDVPAGTAIIRENEIGQGLFVILLGEVQVLRQGAPVARLRSGDLFGEMALLGDAPTNAEVRTVVPTTVLFLGRDYFRRLVSALPALRKYFEDLSRSRAGAKS